MSSRVLNAKAGLMTYLGMFLDLYHSDFDLILLFSLLSSHSAGPQLNFICCFHELESRTEAGLSSLHIKTNC